jgi:hypothetical protein
MYMAASADDQATAAPAFSLDTNKAYLLATGGKLETFTQAHIDVTKSRLRRPFLQSCAEVFNGYPTAFGSIVKPRYILPLADSFYPDQY